jgi:hypothetical protein
VKAVDPEPWLREPDAELTPDLFERNWNRVPQRGTPLCGSEPPPAVLREMERNGFHPDAVLTTCILPPGHAAPGERCTHNGILVHPGVDPAPSFYSLYTWVSTRRLGELVAR